MLLLLMQNVALASMSEIRIHHMHTHTRTHMHIHSHLHAHTQTLILIHTLTLTHTHTHAHTQDLIKYTPPRHADRIHLQLALARCEAIAEHLNEAKRSKEQQSIVTHLSSRISDLPFRLTDSPNRLLHTQEAVTRLVCILVPSLESLSYSSSITDCFCCMPSTQVPK